MENIIVFGWVGTSVEGVKHIFSKPLLVDEPQSRPDWS